MAKIVRNVRPALDLSQITAEDYHANLSGRHRSGAIWRAVFHASTIVGIIVLLALLYTVLNKATGLVAYEARVQPSELAVDGVPLEDLPEAELVSILEDHLSTGLLRRLESEEPLAERSRNELIDLIYTRVVRPEIVETYTLFDSLFHRRAIEATLVETNPGAYLEFVSWVNPEFLTSLQDNDPSQAGISAAILGSLWTIGLTILIAFPVGVAAAVYLEEYAQDSVVNRMIQTNINNLAGVPSIIYGILGLAIFVRALQAITSGAAFGFTDPSTANGRTILSAASTLALLILPLIIINAQEAIRAVPNSLRLASYGLGATRWQTVWHHILPTALPGILTGTILSISRAIGETAPLVVVGASTLITSNPHGPFSKFTALPIQIYQWTSRPQDEYRNLAAAAIVVLLVLLLSLNAGAVILRNRYSRKI